MKTKKLFQIMATYYDMMGSKTKSVPMPHAENSLDFLNDEDVKFDSDYLTTEMPKAKIPRRKQMEDILDREFGENTDDDESLKIHANEEMLHGGLGDNTDDDMFDEEELEEGIDEEMEHTDDPDIAKEIAKDHLMEDDHYYTKTDDGFENFLDYEV